MYQQDLVVAVEVVGLNTEILRLPTHMFYPANLNNKHFIMTITQ